MDKNARRFFFDLDEDGNVVITAPNRTAFDSRHDFAMQGGNTNVAPPSHGGAAELHEIRKSLKGFHGCIEFGGRLFFINVQSVPAEAVK